MNYSFDSRQKNLKDHQHTKVFGRQTLQNFTSQQRQFAQLQFKKIYAEEMSKLMNQISHRKRVKDNLDTLDFHQKQAKAQINAKIKIKMQQSDKKRQQNVNKKLNLYKLNQEKWQNKMNQINKKFKNKNRQAYEKAEQYRLKAEKYWQEKKKSTNQNLNSDRSKASLTNYENSRLHQNYSMNIRKEKLPLLNLQHNKKFKSLKRDNSSNKTIYSPQKQHHFAISHKDLDIEIKKHKEKAVYLQNQKQQMILKKALQKMNIIETKRRQIKHEGKINQPTVPRKPKNRIIDTSYDRHKNRHTIDPSAYGLGNQSSYHLSRSKQSLDKLISWHKQVKQKKSKEQFIHRGEIMDKQHKKNKKNKILRMIRQKVHTMKLETIKNVQNI